MNQADPATEARPFRPLEAIVALGGIQALTMGAGLARTKLLALLLGPAALGIVGVIDQIVSTITHTGSLSTPFISMKFLSRRVGAGAERFRSLFTGLFYLMLIGSLLLTLAIGVLAFLRPELLSEELGGYRLPLLLGLASAPAMATMALLRNVLAAVSRHWEAALAAFIGALALTITAYVGIQLAGVAGLYAGNLLVHVALAGLVYLLLSRRAGVRLAGGPGAVREALRTEHDLGWYLTLFHAMTLVTPIAYLVARVSVLNHHGDVAAGLYYAAYGLAVALRVVLSQAKTLYLAPLLNRPTPAAERISSAADFIRVLTVVVVLGALPLVLFPELAIWLLYSAEFSNAAAFLAPFVVGEMLLLFAGVMFVLLIGFDDLRGHLSINLAGYALIFALALILTPPLGPVGVAYAFVAGNACMLVAAVLRLGGKHGARVFLQPLLRMFAGLVVLASAGWWAAEMAPHPGWRILLYVAVGLGFLALLDAHERRWLLSPWRRQSGADG